MTQNSEGRAADARLAAELAARHAYGRLLAYLVRSWRDLAAVEDALGEAFARALQTWPQTGVPDNPGAWLLVAARHRLTDQARTNATRTSALASLRVTTPGQEEAGPVVPDKRLELMFVCAHPALDAGMHAPLMLQTVLGLSAERIASSFLVSPDTMGRRLGRAKTRIRDTGLAFILPEPEELAARLGSVMDAVYAAYGQGWDNIASDDASRRGLGEEALWLARMLVDLLPDAAEPKGLLSLMLFCDARAGARRVDGRYVPFMVQAIARWDKTLIAAGEKRLGQAARLGLPGRFQLEAAIQSAMIQGRLTGTDMRRPLLTLHDALTSYAPTVGNFVGRAAALADVDGPAAGLAALAALPVEKTVAYQPFWALQAHLLKRSGSSPSAVDHAFTQAIGLCEDEAVRTFLVQSWQG